MTQGPVKAKRRQEKRKKLGTKKGRVFKAPRKKEAKRKLAVESTVRKIVAKKTEREAAMMVAKEGSKLKVLDAPLMPKLSKR